MSEAGLKITTKPGKEKILAGQVDYAREALLDLTSAELIGQHRGFIHEDTRLLTHVFECLNPGYRHWLWAVTLSRAPRSRSGSVCEMALIPGDGAVLAPPWVPWKDRLRPDDISEGQTVPYLGQDPRLKSSDDVFATADDATPAPEGDAPVTTVRPSASAESADSAGSARSAVSAGSADESAAEVGAEAEIDQDAVVAQKRGAKRTLSRYGEKQAMKRWAAHSEFSGHTRAKPEATCQTCGFLMNLLGPAQSDFGVCANEWADADGKVVSLEYGCGAHSETDEPYKAQLWKPSEPVLNDRDLEIWADDWNDQEETS